MVVASCKWIPIPSLMRTGSGFQRCTISPTLFLAQMAPALLSGLTRHKPEHVRLTCMARKANTTENIARNVASQERQTPHISGRIGPTKTYMVIVVTPRANASRWRPSLLGWRPSLLGWRPSLLGWRPSCHRRVSGGTLSCSSIRHRKRHHDAMTCRKKRG